MRNTKSIITAALIAPILALTGGFAVAACSSGGTPAGTAPSTPQATASASVKTAPAAAFNATDAAFAQGMLRLDSQSAAMATVVAGRTTTPQLQQLAGHLRNHGADTARIREWLGDWHQNTPAPYTPGASPPAGTGPGMMDSHDWGDMTHERGHAFDADWTQAMIRHHEAEITLCRAELRSGVNPQARALARTALAERQAELTQLRHWHDTWAHNDDRDR